jgi:isopenicillin N synthase-like dioxygenase
MPNFKGYTALLGENVDPAHQLGDLHEGFDLGWESTDPEKNPATVNNDSDMYAGNVWPDPTLLPDFREAVLEY